MRRFIPSLLLIVILYSCSEKNNGHHAVATEYDSAYHPAIFTDSNRLEKIALAFPVIDSIFKMYADSNHLPGVAYGLVVDGNLVHKGSLGFTDVAKGTAVTSSSLFRIASMSKSFTCMAILKLRDEGKLNLDDPAYLYIPELKNLKYPTAGKACLKPL